MTAETLYNVTGLQESASKYGGKFLYLFLRDGFGKAFRTCLDPKCKNFSRWKPIVDRIKNKSNQDIIAEGIVLTNLETFTRGKEVMINADSFPMELKNGRVS